MKSGCCLHPGYSLRLGSHQLPVFRQRSVSRFPGWSCSHFCIHRFSERRTCSGDARCFRKVWRFPLERSVFWKEAETAMIARCFCFFLYDPLICKTNGFNHHSQYLRIMICKYKHHVYLLRIPGQTVLFLQPLVWEPETPVAKQFSQTWDLLETE